MKTIGLTGGIGSGKSTVAKLFEAMGFPVYIADDEAKRLTQTSQTVRDELIEKFGENLFDGAYLDKQRFAALIFNNTNNLKYANSVIHRAVFQDFKQWKEKQAGSKAVFAESAILFESGFYKEVDYTVTVSAPLELRISRVIERDGLAREEIKSRMKNQLSEKGRNSLADAIIFNNNRLPVLPQAENLIKSLHL